MTRFPNKRCTWAPLDLELPGPAFILIFNGGEVLEC